MAGEQFDPCEIGNIDRQRDAFAAMACRQLFRRDLARSGLARCDVDLGRALRQDASPAF
jgi:hypothetical protein